MEPVLVIMAAGMGSRYGGLKQIDPVDEQGNLIIDFSIYDAIQAGFKKIVFIIKRDIEQDFKEVIGNRISNYIDVDYVFQEVVNIPEEFEVPVGRIKPWGTGHAILSCIDKINGPFAVINADDYYGKEAFKKIYEALVSTKDDDKYRYTMIGYILENTLTEHGHVARGVCMVSDDGKLEGIEERTHIEKRVHDAAFTEDDGKSWESISLESIVSMNMWGFHQSLLEELRDKFIQFFREDVVKNPLKAEYFLPSVVGSLLEEGKATVDVLRSSDKWYGVTYKEDKEAVVNAMRELKAKGLYPEKLWN